MGDRPWTPLILPASWRRTPFPAGPFAFAKGELRVLSSQRREGDGKRWVHVSVSRADRLPSWEDLRDVKDVFLGTDSVAVQVLPRRQDYVNDHPYVLHLFRCLDGDPVPDFRRDFGDRKTL
jgi:hypothetical protein